MSTEETTMNVRTRTGTVHRGIRVGRWVHPACAGTNSNNHLLADTTDAVTCSKCLRALAAAAAKPTTRAPREAKAPRTLAADRVIATVGNRSLVRRDTTGGIVWLCKRDDEVMNVRLTRKEGLDWLYR